MVKCIVKDALFAFYIYFKKEGTAYGFSGCFQI